MKIKRSYLNKHLKFVRKYNKYFSLMNYAEYLIFCRLVI